jgi:hypothetical protein
MSSNPHEVFVVPEDRWNWDKYIQQCDLIDLSDTDRQRAKDSLRYLRGVLGEGYLRRADLRRNPMFFWLFSNAASRARLSMIRFTDALKNFEGAPNYQTILRRIKKPKNLDDLAEGNSVIEVANNFSNAGFAVEFEPGISVADHRGASTQKKPDMKIVNRRTGEEVVIEVSRMKASNHQNLTQRTYDIIWRVLIHEGMWTDSRPLKDGTGRTHILPYALIHRGIEDDELIVIVDRIRQLISEVRTGGEFKEMIIPDVIEVGIASYDDHYRALEWAAARGIMETSFVEGPDILSDEIVRAKRKLHDKLKQLPADRPGIIVMPAGENFLFFAYDVRWLAAVLAEEVEKYSKLLCVILFDTFDDGREESGSVDIGAHTFTRRVRSDKAVERSLLIRNMNCNLALSADTLGMINKAFIVT